MTLKISRSQVSTQPNPTQPNPWMDQTHDQLCSTFIKWTGWTLAMALPWWQHDKHCRAYYYYYYYFFANMGLDVVSCQKIKKWFVLASSDGFVYDGCTSLSLSLSLANSSLPRRSVLVTTHLCSYLLVYFAASNLGSAGLPVPAGIPVPDPWM